MKIKYLFQKTTLLFLSVTLFANFAFAQKPGNTVPRQEKLLNGLKVLIWNVPSADKITVKVRVHSGSSFDPQDREGVMKLLSGNIFPNEAAQAFFNEDLGGSLEIINNYDYIQVTATARTDQFLTMLETLAAAISNPTIDKETTAVLKTALSAKVHELGKDPAYIADRTVAKRLFGTFPYGRPQMGTPDSIQKIDFADLKFAKERLFSADNATVTISGNLNGDQTMRAVRRYFGAWLKSDKKIPSTFRQPDPPAAGMPVFESPVANKSEFRFAARGLARNDPDFYAAKILQQILERRVQAKEGQNAFVLHDQHILPGAFVFGVSDWNLGRIRKEGDKIALPVTDGYQNNFLKDPVTQEEFDRTNREWIARINPANISELWLDVDTFKLGAANSEAAKAANVNIVDVQRVLEKLQKEPVAYVLVFANEKPDEVPATPIK